MPKHQWLVDAIIDSNQGDFDRRMQAVLDERDASTHTIILSTEGIANHWWDFSPEGLTMLASLKQTFDVSCWIWFREPNDFFRSYYLQILKNGRHPRFEAYGQDRSPLEMLSMPWVAKHLDYRGLMEGLEHVFGADAIYPFAYTDDIVGALTKLLPVSLPHEPELRVNETNISSAGLERLRTVNRITTSNAEKQAALTLAANTAPSDRSEAFELGAEDKAAIANLNDITIEALAIMGEKSFARWRTKFGAGAPD